MSPSLGEAPELAEGPADALYMLRLPLDWRRLVQFGHEHKLFGNGVPQDDGYLVHALFAALFGPAAPKPFVLPGPGVDAAGLAAVLAYAAVSCERLREEARAFADPSAYETVHWENAASKPMPCFPREAHLGFKLRACPVRRLARGAPGRPDRERAPEYAAGAEVDAFQAQWLAPELPGSPRARQEVYSGWLGTQFAAVGGANLVAVRLTAFRRTRLARRGLEQPGRRRPLWSLERPDATFRGALEVTDPAAFQRMLARGIGRHRAFGFGMLLLQRADAAPS